jgi:hypothetical protein
MNENLPVIINEPLHKSSSQENSITESETTADRPQGAGGTMVDSQTSKEKKKRETFILENYKIRSLGTY